MNTIKAMTNVTNQQSFQSLYINRMPRAELHRETVRLSNYLSQNKGDIFALLKNAGPKKYAFFDMLAEKYNYTQFKQPVAKRDDSFLVNQIYKMVGNPKKAHFELIEAFKGSFDDLSNIFLLSNGKNKIIKFVNKINSQIIKDHKHVNPNIITELLKSPHIQEYAKHFKKYVSYLKLYRNNEDVVKNLDKMVSEKTFNKKVYDEELQKQYLKSNFLLSPTSTIFTPEVYANNFSNERDTILNKLYRYYNLPIKSNNESLQNTVLNIFMSTNKKNYKIRSSIISSFPNLTQDENIKLAQLTKLYELFNIIDNNKGTKRFVKKILNSDTQFKNIYLFQQLFANIPTKELNIFSHNIMRILNMAPHDENLIPTVQKELKNPFFETEDFRIWRQNNEKSGYFKPVSIFSKAQAHIINLYNIIRFNVSNIIFGKSHTLHIPSPEINNSANIYKNTDLAQNQTDIKIQKNALDVAKQLQKQQRLIQRENVRKDVIAIIDSKPGKKTIARQKDAYSKNATKMRLTMLPEIFASIADTRKADRTVGKMRSNSSNKDALDLYLLINGHNKKFVNYLLKKRNTDNTRMFEVKDIITTVRKAEAKIAQNKKLNPEYNTKDARRYYNHLFEAKIQQYGKLTKPTKNMVA